MSKLQLGYVKIIHRSYSFTFGFVAGCFTFYDELYFDSTEEPT